MRRLGSLDDWTRYLDARSDDEAAAALAGLSRQLDALYAELAGAVRRLYDSPSGEVAEALLTARSAVAEAGGMLDSVRVRFDAGGRESA